jgi:hypothetical protein
VAPRRARKRFLVRLAIVVGATLGIGVVWSIATGHPLAHAVEAWLFVVGFTTLALSAGTFAREMPRRDGNPPGGFDELNQFLSLAAKYLVVGLVLVGLAVAIRSLS